MPDERKIANSVSVLHLLKSYHDIYEEIMPGCTTVAQPSCNIIFDFMAVGGCQKEEDTPHK